MTRERSWHARIGRSWLLLLLLLTMLTWSLGWCPPRHYDVAWLHCWPQHRGWLLVVVKIPPRQNEAKHHDLGCRVEGPHKMLGPELVLTFWRSPVRLGRWSVMIARRGARVLARVPAILPTSTLPCSQQPALDILSSNPPTPRARKKLRTNPFRVLLLVVRSDSLTIVTGDHWPVTMAWCRGQVGAG